uniref:39S ribosomal protein L38, mitochondrial n=1 Tax=Aceria tosichella TaxID=561515 RepID=A0A6G1SH04_9ACAR
MLAANRLLTARCLLNRVRNQQPILRQSRATYIKGYWPEPFTQQTLEQFLDDIDYFERPTTFIDIGLKLDKPQLNEAKDKTADLQGKVTNESSLTNSDQFSSLDVGRLLDMLGEDVELPSLDIDDAAIDPIQLKNLAISQGIYRDLFHDYKPRRDHIKFTPEQAERMSKLVPYHWISDQPHARADRHLKRTEPLFYFEPVVGISARFVNGLEDEDTKYAHTAYHGNIIPASEALIKPSITLDGRRLLTQSQPSHKLVNESQFDNWSPGRVSCENFDNSAGFHTLFMLNLDSIHPNCANLHWMLTNIRPSKSKKILDVEEVCEYLPVHGIRGFGYSRYVFLLLRHESKLDVSNLNFSDFSPKSRRFEVKKFIESNSNIMMTPVGISWFQTVWDHSSNNIFHEYMKMAAPVYELVQEKMAKRDMLDKAYPGKIPFNIFMDHYRDPKEINEKVLLERLKGVNPFDYKDQYVPPKVPPTVFQDENLPSWMNSIMFKKKNKIGYWRGLRPASATIPLNNNADLDYPIRPLRSTKKRLPAHPNLYPAKPKMKLLKDLPYSKPINEHPNVFIQEDHDVHVGKVHEMMKDLKREKAK